MVTHSTTNLPVSVLSVGEQTRPRILHYLWSYVLDIRMQSVYDASVRSCQLRYKLLILFSLCLNLLPSSNY
ncbi:hypothetical protein GGI42DRAFT_334079 [Trichoderma sp. SZMC 28013]